MIGSEGVSGLYKGLSVSILREMTFSTTRIALYEPIKQYLSSSSSNNTSSSSSSSDAISLSTKLTAGLISGGIAAAIFNPTDMLKVIHPSINQLINE